MTTLRALREIESPQYYRAEELTTPMLQLLILGSTGQLVPGTGIQSAIPIRYTYPLYLSRIAASRSTNGVPHCGHAAVVGTRTSRGYFLSGSKWTAQR